MPEYIYSPRGLSSPVYRVGLGELIPGRTYNSDEYPGIENDPDFKTAKVREARPASISPGSTRRPA